MKLSVTTTTLALALATSVLAAPTNIETNVQLTRREQEVDLIAELNEIAALKSKRSLLTEREQLELAQRDYTIVTQILELLNTNSFAAKFIQRLVDDKNLQPILTDTIEWLIKNNIINLTTLFTALDESDLAATVIRDIINDCDYYTQIYKLIESLITGDDSSSSSAAATKRELVTADLVIRADSSGSGSAVTDAAASSDPTSDSFINELLNSLAKSGLASDLVKRLLVDREFLSYGASLIVDLFRSGSLTIGDVIDALTQSSLIPDLFREFFTVNTLKTVITNALAAASGTCDTNATSLNPNGTTKTATSTTKGSTNTATNTTATRTNTTSTSTSTSGGGKCKKRRKRNYH